MVKTICTVAALAAIFAVLPSVALAQSREQRIVENSASVFQQVVSLRIQAIPQKLLADAEGVAIIPNMIKGGFVVGARHGKGMLLVRDGNGSWELPVFISLTGGNVGWQIGLQSTDLILVFKTRKSIDGILNGKLTLGADAAAAAGPVGRQAAAATDGRLKAEIYSYSRSRGLFAGVSVDGSILRVESDLNTAFYGKEEIVENYQVPEAAVQLVEMVASYCQPANAHYANDYLIPDETIIEDIPPPRGDEISRADVVRSQLADAVNQLTEELDSQWMKYLRIPPEIFRHEGHPSLEAVRKSLMRLDRVAEDPQYAALTDREEFQQTWRLLREYEQVLPRPESARRIPPPPVVVELEPAEAR